MVPNMAAVDLKSVANVLHGSMNSTVLVHGDGGNSSSEVDSHDFISFTLDAVGRALVIADAPWMHDAVKAGLKLDYIHF
ncbi:hypothetical protein V6N13_012487 [Hibiscus sabdariffa]|uniref:Uncharacterized protein n=1 Tax=Hibiscus sabdariffa TaxID=183260 RepID=A0ABR2SG71_9ROSI